MSDDSLEKFLKTQTKPPTGVGEEIDDCVAFGFLRGVRDRAVMLELRQKDGNIKAFGYAWLSQAEYDPSTGITLHLGGQPVRIRGRNLNTESRQNVRLFQGLLRHRVPWIQEADQATLMQAGEHHCVIERIEW